MFRGEPIPRHAGRHAGFDRTTEIRNARFNRRAAATERASGSARTTADRTGHRLSPDEVRIIIDGGKLAVYERILGRKAGKTIWRMAPARPQLCASHHVTKEKRRVAHQRNPAFVTRQLTKANPSASPPEPRAQTQRQQQRQMRQPDPKPAQPPPPPRRPRASHHPSHRPARESD